MNLKEVLLGIKNWGENKFASKEDLENLVGPGINFKVVNSLPPVSEGDSKVLYLVGPVGAGADKYEEFIFSDSQYVMIGDTSVDLSNYVTSSQLESSLEGILRVTDVYEWAKAENKPSYDYSEIANAPSNVSDFTNDAGYLTSHQDISGKQDVIVDLDEIRAGAALGSSALQSHQDISGKQDVIADLEEIRSGAALGASALQAHQDISGKQDVIDDLDEIRSGAALGATAYQKPASGIPASDLADGVITGNVGYELPEGGIPKSDLAASVQSSLDKAESALQEHQDISGKANVGDSYTKEEVDSLLDDIKNPKEESDSYDYIYDEASWNASFESGALKKYYTKYPDEDRYNTQEHRWAWAVDKVDGEWPEWCVQCWEGAVNANAAKFPWICPNFDDDINSKIIFRYEGKSDVYPWGENVFGIGRKADGSDRLWGIASVAEEFGDKGFLIPENQNNGEESWSGEVGANNFDISKFTMILVKQSDDLKAYVDANFQPKGEYITEHQDISGKANISDLSEVATSGSYNDLSDKPEIPSLSGYATESYVNEKFEDAFGINAQGVSEIAAVLNDNDAATGILSAISEKADRSELFSGSYNDLSDKPAIPEVPTNVSAFTNDAGYLTSHQDISGKANAADLSEVAMSGSYNDLLDKPEMPVVPENVSAFTNDSGYLTEHQDLSEYTTRSEIVERVGIVGQEVQSNAFEYIYDKTSWEASYNNGVLHDYYERYPSEDLWNFDTNSAPGFNDKIYTVKEYTDAECEGEYVVKQYKAQWYSDNGVQKIIDVEDNTLEYYIPTFFDTPADIFELFAGAERGYVATPEDLVSPCGKWIKVDSVSFGGPNVRPAWEAASQAWGAQFPWIAVRVGDVSNQIVKFEYTGKEPVYPWGEGKFGLGGKAWGIASVAREWKDNSFLVEVNKNNGNESWEGELGVAFGNFDIANFKMVLVTPSSVKNYVDASVSSIVIPEVPTNVSDFTNDAGYLTSHQDISGKQDIIDDLAEIRSGAALGATSYQKPASGIPASDLEDGAIPQIDLSDYVTTEALNSATSLESGDGANSFIQKGNNNAVAFGANSTAFGTSSTNAKDRGITSESTVETIVSEWVASDPESDKFALTLGEASHIEGNNCLALGKNSHAEGNGTIAGNNSSHAEGTGTKATGKYSHAEGLETIAEGTGSHAEGKETHTSGDTSDYSHAEGESTVVEVRAGHAEGYKSISARSGYTENTLTPHAQGTGTSGWVNAISHAEGNATIAQGLGAHAEGEKTFANNRTAHAEGLETIASGAYASHAEGEATIASGEDSHAEGFKTKANALCAHAEGNRTVINEGGRSHTEGYGTYASGIGAHAEGINGYYIVLQRSGNSGNVYDIRQIEDMTPADALAAGKYPKVGDLNAEDGKTIKSVDTENHTITMSGNWGGNNKWSRLYFIINDIEDTSLRGNDGALEFATHAEGVHTKANGWGSHAEGEMAVANGDTSHAEGWRTTTENQCEHAQGQYNVSHKASGTFGDAGNTIHSVGIGNRTDDYGNGDRKNAVEIMQNGDAYLYGIGGYDGVSLSGASTLKQVIDSKGTYSKPSAGIPASDLASGVIPDVSGLETRVGNIESQLEDIEALLASI